MRSFGRSLLVGLALAATQIVPTQAAIKIMPLGDSITEWGCWRQKLWNSLSASGHAAKIDFVGSMNTPANQCSGTYDIQHEGHAGYLAINIANQNQLVNWLASTKPEIVLFHLGTNDIFNSRSTNDIIASFTKLVDQMRASNPNMIILVAKIIPIGIGGFANGVNALNNAIPAWAASKSTANSPITVVDQFTGFSGSGDNSDGIHPNDGGDAKIAKNWLEPLKTAINLAESRTGGGTGNPSPSTSYTQPITSFTTSTTSVVPSPTAGTVPAWGQCGGNGYSGPTGCVSGYTCKKLNDWYSQCT